MERANWENLEDEELLKLRIRELRLQYKDSPLTSWVERVQSELAEKQLQLKPAYYFGDEWFSPEGDAAISIPFFLAHPRLRKLERSFMMECEGESESDFLKLLRHEMGHVFDHVFKVSRRKKWQKLFGSNKKPYTPESYRPRPYSKNFVHNIANDYAQAHPDEDFAETFAVWLNPDSHWKEAYRGWGALRKLEYIDELAKEFSNKEHPAPKGKFIYDASQLKATLGHYYKRKKRNHSFESPDFFDADLLRIFSLPEKGVKSEKASRFLRRHRKQIMETVARWSKERKYVIYDLYSKLVQRSQVLGLKASRDHAHILNELVGWLSVLTTTYRLTGKWTRRSSV